MKKISIVFIAFAAFLGLFACSANHYQTAKLIVSHAVDEYYARVEKNNQTGVVERAPGATHIYRSRIENKQIIVTDLDGNDKIFKIRGVALAPDIDGDTYWQTYKAQLPLIKAINANAIRTYRPLFAKDEYGTVDYAKTLIMLDDISNEGIYFAIGFSYEDMAPGGEMEQFLRHFGNHPAVFMLVLGNEYNYHYGEWFTKEQWISRLKRGVQLAQNYAPNTIIATVHGEMPSQTELNEYVGLGIELVMMNIYRGSNFGFSKDNWYKMTNTMPWVIGEFGRSSKDGNGKDTSKIQASYLETLIRAMEQGFLFQLVDDPTKGSGEINSVIGAEDSLGIYDKKLNPKQAVAVVAAEYLAKSQE